MHTYFTPAALGPTWPLLLCAALFFAATTAFLFFTRNRGRENYAPDEARFLRRLYDATELFSTIALFTGVLGTCLHLIVILPELNRVLHDSAAKLDPQTAANTATQLRTMWASAIAGLVLGGLWGETLRFLLKPRLRDQPCFLVKRFTKHRAAAPEPKLDDAWQARDAQGIY